MADVLKPIPYAQWFEKFLKPALAEMSETQQQYHLENSQTIYRQEMARRAEQYQADRYSRADTQQFLEEAPQRKANMKRLAQLGLEVLKEKGITRNASDYNKPL